ncbi:MAG TPA: transporter [Firmicutes bacterium]|nr:transporter [Bacillota bacterium]
MRNFAMGRYRPYNTPMHRLDARVKIIALVSLMVAVFLGYGSVPLNFIIYGLIFLGLVVAMIIGKVSFLGVLRAIKAMWFMMIFILLFNVLIPTKGGDYFLIGDFKVYYSSIYNTLYIVFRLFLMLMITSILTATTSPMDMTFGLEFLLTPLKWIKVPVSSFAMILALALRFIPTLTEDTERLMRAQASRGVDFKEGKLKEKIKSITSLIIPLFSSALMRSGDLAIAMECRGYDPKAKRTKFRRKNWRISDTLWLLFFLVIFGGSIALAVLGGKYDFFQMFLDLFK